MFGGFELQNATTVYILIRGNSLGSIGVTQAFLDLPRVRLYDAQGRDLISDASGPGFNGCNAANGGSAVVSYYASVPNQPPHVRDGCTAQALPAAASSASPVRVTETPDRLVLSAGDLRVELDRATGRLASLTRGGATLPLTNGPRIVGARGDLASASG